MRREIAAGGRVAALAAALGLVILAALGGFAGCAKVRGTIAPNRPPETTLWVDGDLDTVSHTLHVYWDGEDADGYVVGFTWRWIYAAGLEPPGYDPNTWFFTDRRDTIFTVYSPNGVNFPTLEVRAIDNTLDGVADANGQDYGTADPEAARQLFSLSNLAPTVQLTSTPPDTTLPVAVLEWRGFDPDGIIALAHYRVWLDGEPQRDTVVTQTIVTLPEYFFRNAAGEVESRRRTAYISCIDAGGRVSVPDSFSWFVRPPTGFTLLVDDMPATVGGASTYDGFYRGELNTRLGAGSYTILDLEKGAYLRTGDAIRETFSLFENVFWYSEANPSLSAVLQQADQPIRDYLSSGGNLFLTSSRLVGTGGALGSDFARDVLGATEIRVNQMNQTTGFVIGSGQYLIGGSSPFDSLRALQALGSVEAFVLADPGEAAYVAPPGTLDTLHTDNWAVGVSRRYASQGRIVYLSFPLRGMNQSFSGHSGRSSAELQKVFDLFSVR